jgi:hypothetical protein
VKSKEKKKEKPSKIVDPNNEKIEIDADVAEKARKLLQEDEHHGDDHYPGEENTKRISLYKDLPRRT